MRRRFPKARVARYDPEATRGARAEAQRAAAAAADVVIGTRGALRLFGPASLGLAAFVSPDQLLRRARLPGGRAHVRLSVGGGRARAPGRTHGDPVAESLALRLRRRSSARTWPASTSASSTFRRELGYPPFRRLAVITVRGRTGDESRALADEVVAALRGAPGLTVYPPPRRRARASPSDRGEGRARPARRSSAPRSGRGLPRRALAVSWTWRWIPSNGRPEGATLRRPGAASEGEARRRDHARDSRDRRRHDRDHVRGGRHRPGRLAGRHPPASHGRGRRERRPGARARQSRHRGERRPGDGRGRLSLHPRDLRPGDARRLGEAGGAGSRGPAGVDSRSRPPGPRVPARDGSPRRDPLHRSAGAADARPHQAEDQEGGSPRGHARTTRPRSDEWGASNGPPKPPGARRARGTRGAPR